jgi:hypothetical protein
MARKDPASPDKQATDVAATTPPEGPADMPSRRGRYVEAISITCAVPGGRRRAGYRFGTEPVVIAVADLTDEQIAQLRQDGDLRIEPAEPAA